MFWTIVGALFFFFVILPIILGLMMHKEFWYFIAGTLGVLILIVVIILLKSKETPNFSDSLKTPYYNSYDKINPLEETKNDTVAPIIKNLNEKCVTEDVNVKICDLKFSSTVNTESNHRNLSVEGNEVACVDMSTGEVSKNSIGSLRASLGPSFCATDFGIVYIDPTLQVTKQYGSITQKDYNSPYVIPRFYETCLWAYEDGNGQIPYLEVLGNVGNRSGFNVTAFCKNGDSQIDIYTSKDRY